MAPTQPSPKSKEPDQTHGGRVQKPKRKIGPVRRLENGLLDVTRKSGKHVKTIKQNSLTPLLQLPPEIRNKIWEYALGGNIFEITRMVQSRRHTKKSVQPKHAFPLLGVCRQIYAETALLPYKVNAFKIPGTNFFDRFYGFHKVQWELISEVHIQFSTLFPPSSWDHEHFPGLKKVEIKVYEFPGSALGFTLRNTREEMEKACSRIREKYPNVQVVGRLL